MKPSTEKKLKYSAYAASLVLLYFSANQLYKKNYFNAWLLASFTLPILVGSHLCPKIDKIEDEAERNLENRTKEDVNKAA